MAGPGGGWWWWWWVACIQEGEEVTAGRECFGAGFPGAGGSLSLAAPPSSLVRSAGTSPVTAQPEDPSPAASPQFSLRSARTQFDPTLRSLATIQAQIDSAPGRVRELVDRADELIAEDEMVGRRLKGLVYPIYEWRLSESLIVDYLTNPIHDVANFAPHDINIAAFEAYRAVC